MGFYGNANGVIVVVLSFFTLFILLLGVVRDLAQNNLDRHNRTLGATQQNIAAFLFEMRVFRHDIANLFYGWQGAVMEGDINKIRAYNSEMNSVFSLINNNNSLHLQKLGSGSISRLLSEKLNNAVLKEIPASLLVEGVYDHLKMKESDLCRILGILIDNAMHAASACDCPIMHIHVFREADSVNFLIRNTASDSLIESISSGCSRTEAENDYTSMYGIGLRSAYKIVERYSKTDLFIYTRGRFVEAILTLPA